ncbi:MAG: DNA polymerase III subunit delta [Lentisphaerae bacterium]|nr:DNA polymerase III subunit delta [Lentisphaerota bacterium]
MRARATTKSAQVSLLIGENQFSVQAAARERINRFLPIPDQALGLEIIDAQADKIEQALACLRRCLEAVRTVGLLSGRKAVWLRGADSLGQPKISGNKDVQELLRVLAETIAGGMTADQLLIITALKIDRRSSFYKACERSAEIVEFDLGEKPWEKDREALSFAGKTFAEAGLQIGAETLHAFVLRVGTDTMQIAQEISKLATYLGERHVVQADDIAAITSACRELVFWQLEDAIVQRDIGRALTVLRQLLAQREKPIFLMICLEGQFRNLLIGREALDNHWIRAQQPGKEYLGLLKNSLPAALDKQLDQALASEKGAPMHPFRAGKLAVQAREFSRREIEERRAWILAARRQMVSSAVPEELILEYLILKLCEPRAPRLD